MIHNKILNYYKTNRETKQNKKQNLYKFKLERMYINLVETKTLQIQIKSNVTNKLLGQMSLNATTQSVVINSLNPGGRYSARVAAQTAGGLGPYSTPAALHMDPSFISRPPK